MWGPRLAGDNYIEGGEPEAAALHSKATGHEHLEN